MRQVASRYGVSDSALSRHRKLHVARAIAAARAERSNQIASEVEYKKEQARDEALDVVRQLKAINAACLEILQTARASGKESLSLQAVDRIHRQVTFQAKLLGEIQDTATVNVALLPEWHRLRLARQACLSPDPWQSNFLRSGRQRSAWLRSKSAPDRAAAKCTTWSATWSAFPLARTIQPSPAERPKWPPASGREQGALRRVYLDATGLGQSVVDLFGSRMDLAKVVVVYFTHGDRRLEIDGEIRLGKAYLVGRLQALLQVGGLHLPKTPDAEALAKDLLDYEILVTEDANDRYGAFRVGPRDDLITALGLAAQPKPPGPGIY